jgi:hypothetical protein
VGLLATYKHFITLYLITKTRPQWRAVLLDVRKGTISSSIIVPADDICNMPRIRYHIMIGFQRKALTSCDRQGRFKATIYDLVETNRTTGVHLILKNGTEISFRILDIHESKVKINGISNVFDEGIYIGRKNAQGCYIDAYRKVNNYHVMIYQIKQTGGIDKSTHFGLKFNLRFFLFFCLPGPRGIVLKEIYSPRDGLTGKGLGSMTFQEIITSFYPHSNDINYNHFHLNPNDGSLIHLIKSQNKYFTFVEIYKTVK